MRDICAQGAAHGVWKEITAVVVGSREEMWDSKAEGEVMSAMADMTRIICCAADNGWWIAESF